ncbi:MAG: hypothetical protein KJI69_03535 [Patescibacteria group bacterium]|nr:hypothetical protein [Patescibacteria group bacterium]
MTFDSKTGYLGTPNQQKIVKEIIMSYIKKGVTDKQELYSKVVNEIGIPRPTVRRIAKLLRDELLSAVSILEQQVEKPKIGEGYN